MTIERQIIRSMAETILDRVDDPESDTETMLAQCVQAVKLARAEYEAAMDKDRTAGALSPA